MKLKEFIETFVCPNTLIRLHYKTKSGHEEVGDFNLTMEWELKDGEYKDSVVIGVTDILYPGNNYPEAVNIVIERN